MWDKFSPAEMERRRGAARDLMRRHGLSALLVYGDSGANRHNHANVFWLSNHLDLHHAYLLLPADPALEPQLYVGLRNHVPGARAVTDLPVEWGGYDPAETIARRLRHLGADRGALGLVGVNATFGIGIPYQHYQVLREALPTLEIIDVTRDFAALRAVKSAEEVRWLRRAAEYTDRAIDALRDGIRSGLREFALVGIVEGAYRAHGGLPHITFLRSMPMDDPSGCVPAPNPSDRVIRRGDVIITEISASHWGYTGQIHRPIFVGADPTPPWQALFDTARQAFDRIAAAMVPTATERDVIRAGSIIGERGYAIYDDLVHGYGVDIHPPVIDRTCTAYWPWDESHPAPEGRRFARHMAVVIQPNPITPDERMGLQLGALTLVTEQGAQSLHRIPFEPIVVTG